MKEVERYLAERQDEVRQHLALLSALDTRSASPPTTPELRVEVRQVLILKSGVLVHLYNIVEATMNRILDALAEAAAGYHPRAYTDPFFAEWLRTGADPHGGLHPDEMLKRMSSTGRALVSDTVELRMVIRGGSGNWDDNRIDRLAQRLGVKLAISDEVKRGASEHYRDDKSRLAYLRQKRNDLAHGVDTFEEGASDRTSEELRDLTEKVLSYLQEVLKCFVTFNDSQGFLNKRQEVA